MHTTLEQIAELARAVADRAGGNGVHGDLGRIARLAEEAQERPGPYTRVLVRGLLEEAQFKQCARDDLRRVLLQVLFVVRVEDGEAIEVRLGGSFTPAPGGQILTLSLRLDDKEEEVSSQLRLFEG